MKLDMSSSSLLNEFLPPTPSSSMSPPPSLLSAEVENDLRELDGLVFPTDPYSQHPSQVTNSAPESLRLDQGDDNVTASGNTASGDEADEGDEENESEADGEADGVKRWVFNEAPKQRKVSERKRADVAAFEQWIEDNQSKLAKDSSKLVTDTFQSANAMVKGFENRKIITSPRDYQLELFERAKERNTIAVLDTGSGKTLIAALLLQWTIQNELENRAKGQPKRISFFLVDKVALVFQQHAVLECNLDHPVTGLCGEIVDAVSSLKQFWQDAFENNMAIVCTAEVLNRCLHHSFIHMDQINLLIFDEAHHTKKNHPYARIIKDYYIEAEDKERRPRILGMTASPVDAQIEPKRAAAELEGLLHSQIATIADPTTLQKAMGNPKQEIVVEYDRRGRDWATNLHQLISARLGNHSVFRKPLEYARAAAAELGPWIADRYWQLMLGAEETAKLEFKTERNLLRESALDQFRDSMVDQVRAACDLVSQHNFSRPALDTNLLSSKVIQLVKLLRDQFAKSSDDAGDAETRCIVFVTQRTTTMLLADLLGQPEIKIPGVEVGVLVGSGRSGADINHKKTSFRDQVLTISKFKRGELNCIFATSVGEEGLDIPDCNVIVRFDLYNTLIQYIQSRGRARQEHSVYVHMVERGNQLHRRKIQENRVNENALRQFCEALPEDRKLNGNNLNMDYFLRKERGQKQYTVPETGAKLNFKQSLICLASFVASLPHSPDITLTPEYVVMTVPGGFQCEVILPNKSPIKNALGGVYGSKAVSKCSAAFEMCLALIKGKYLDSHLQPIFTKQLPAMRNARLAISSKKKGEYNMRMKPSIWSNVGFPEELYATALTLADPDSLGRPSRPLLLLTRQPISQLPLFPLFFGTNRFSNVHCIPLPNPMRPIDQEIAQKLTVFTHQIFDDVFSKDYNVTPDQLPYFLAPARHGHDFAFSSAQEVHEVIDWDTVGFVQDHEHVEYDFNQGYTDEFFTNKFVTDPWDGGRKFILQQRCHDMKPTDPVPDGIVAPRHRAWRMTCKTQDVLNYSVSLWSKSRKHTTFSANQPVVEARLLPIRRNLLDDNISTQDTAPQRCFLILEPLKISPLPVDVVAMAYNIPAIVHKLESTLIALDACRLLDLDIRPDLALEAVTKDCDNSDEHNSEKINFQAGMGANYERLEFLGDSFLKMATTISVYTLIPDKGEFEYHVERMLLVCNRNLFNNALEVHLEEYIRSMAFNGRTWYPEGLTLNKGKRTDTNTRHTLGDKSIADVCEALIGAAYLTVRGDEKSGNGKNSSLDLPVKAVTAMVKDKKHAMTVYSDYYAAYKKPDWQTSPANAIQTEIAKKFAQRMGYTFKYPRVLRSAFQHPTYPSIWERLPSYQRLEFLGDALYDMVCVDYLYHRFPGKDPQWLTEHKMAMVSNQFLGCLAVSLDFHKSMMYVSPSIAKDVLEYVFRIGEALREAKEEAVADGKTEDDYARDYWVNVQKPPKCLPDVVEAYIGAVFVDSEYDYGTVQSFFHRHVEPYFANMRLYDTFANNHPVTLLANLMQLRFACTEWRLLTKEMNEGDDAEGPVPGLSSSPKVVCGMRAHGQTIAHAVAESSRYAKITVAKKAMEALRVVSVEGYKREYGCACGGGRENAAAAGSEVKGKDEEEHGTAI